MTGIRIPITILLATLPLLPTIAYAQPPDDFPDEDPLDAPQEEPPPPEEPAPDEPAPPAEEAPPEFEEEMEVETFDRLGTEPRDGAARARLVAGQTGHGIVLGAQTCAIVDCAETVPTIALPTIGSGAGLGLSLWATHRTGIHRGHADAINSGTVWGAWGGFATSTLADLPVTTSIITGQLAGLGTGHLLARTLQPTSGDVLTVNTGGLWAPGYYVLISEGIIQRGVNDERLVAEMAALSVAGGLAGGILTGLRPVSAGRIGAINAAGVLVAALGAATPVLLFDDDSQRAVATGALTGATMGLATSTYFTARWDEEELRASTPSWSVTPGGGGTIGVSGRW